MSDYQNFAIQVTRTSTVTINVLARDIDSAKRNALSTASSKGYASEDIRTEAIAVWPDREPEDDFIIPTERGYEVRRGWFWEASLDDRAISITSAQMWTENPDADARDPQRTMRSAYEGFVENNETIFSVTKRYGFAARLEGDEHWSNVVNTQAQAEREARHDINVRDRRRKNAEFRRLVAVTIDRMKAPGNGNALLRVRGGRWTVKNELADRDPTKVEEQALEWSVPASVVSALMEAKQVDVIGQFSQSGKPFHVGLSDAVLRPF